MASAPKHAQTPLQARLDVPLDSKRTAVGSAVYASVLFPWDGPDCSLAKGSVISGHVLHAELRKGSANEAELTIVFDKADCNRQHEIPASLLLYAIVEPVDSDGQAMRDRAGLFGSISPHPVMGMGGASAPVASINTADATRTDVSGGLSRSSQPTAVKAGQVLGDSSVAIDVNKGSEGSSRIHSARRDFRINTGAQLVLIPAPHPESSAEPELEHRAVSDSTAGEAVSLPPAMLPSAHVAPVDETEICAADCSEISGLHGSENVAATTRGTFLRASVVRLGYRPARYRPWSGFDHETTLSFLANDQLLLTFDSHHLRERTGEVWHASTRRSVRAALLDANTLLVERLLEWQVDDDGQYLWKAGPGRVLVHRQGALHLLGPDLHELAVFPARGDLLWVATSPSGKQIAFGLRHERHNREAHETILRLAGTEPVEDAEMELVESTGKVLLTKSGESTMVPPVLTDKDELLVQNAGVNRWRLVEQAPDSSSGKPVVTLTSTCPPRVSAPQPDSIFVVGCATQGGRWFRLLRENGHAVVTSPASEEEIEQTAIAADRNFAVHVVTLAHATSGEAPRSADEIESERIQVRRERDGKLLLETMERQFPPSEDGYALSPDGKRLATMTGTDVELRSVE